MRSMCPRHPQSPATDLCVSCGACVCPTCAWVIGDSEVYCPDCKPATTEAQKQRSPSVEMSRGAEPQGYIRVGAASSNPLPKPRSGGKAKASIVVGLLGCMCFPLAMIGLVLAIQELNAIARGDSPPENKPTAIVGVVLNSFGFVSLFLWAVSLLGS